jgi:hypothetical protein
MIKRLAYQFIIIALVLNGLVFAAPQSSYANIDVKEMTALFGEKIFICTSEGYKWVKWSDLEAENSKHQKQDCKQCAVSCGGASAINNLSAEIADLNILPQQFYLQQAEIKRIILLNSGQPRSPPYFS